MKLTIERGALLNALGHVQNVVERRNTIPILSNILVEATGKGSPLHRHRSRTLKRSIMLTPKSQLKGR